MGSGLLGDVSVPNHEPPVPSELIAIAIQELSGELEAVFRPWVADRVTLSWLDVDDDRLGMTRFEEGSTELVRRRRLRLDPGEITIGLHPALDEDELLYNHTFIHEFLHAAGMTLHTVKHDELVDKIAPAPKLPDSPLLQRMRDSVLGAAKVQEWDCKNCGFTWNRKTVKKPTRCIKCARPL